MYTINSYTLISANLRPNYWSFLGLNVLRNCLTTYDRLGDFSTNDSVWRVVDNCSSEGAAFPGHGGRLGHRGVGEECGGEAYS